MKSIAYKQQEVKYDAYGWPVNPATGVSYTQAEIIADASLPMPKDGYAVRLIERRRAQLCGVAEKADREHNYQKRNRKTTSRSRKTSKRFEAASVLSTGGFFAQAGKVASAMAELVKRVNGNDEPAEAEPVTMEEALNTSLERGYNAVDWERVI
jgi:hypothetical protein